MSGHASPKELEVVERLEKMASAGSISVEEIVELATLYLEPCHRSDNAIELLERLLQRDSDNPCAIVWLAYCYLYYRMDRQSLLRGRDLLRRASASRSSWLGAFCLVLADTLDALGDSSLEERTRLLEDSVSAAPGWVYNRHRLARAYIAAGRRQEAAEQIRIAVGNVLSDDLTWGSAQRMFETCVSGRIADGVREELQAELEDIEMQECR